MHARRATRTFVAGAIALALATAGFVAQAQTARAGPATHAGPLMTRILDKPIWGTQYASQITPAEAAPSPVPSTKTQVSVLKAVLANMQKNYTKDLDYEPGPVDIYDYGIGSLWLRGIDGAGTTIAVVEGWDYPQIAETVAGFDKAFGLPNPDIQTIYPTGDHKLPSKCPPGMVALGSYGSCQAWAGELTLDVITAHLIAPYAKIVIAVAPADSQVTDDAADQVAPPEMMEAVENIAAKHIANVISISDDTGESTYGYGTAQITAQNAGELAAAAAGIPLLVASGDCGVVQNLAVANGQCEDVSQGPDTAAWDDSPWVTAVGGSLPNLNSTGGRVGPDYLWHADNLYSEGAGYSSVYTRPTYEDGVTKITKSNMRSVPDITMDASDGTSEAAPMLAGVLALATQENKGNVGPINPTLYDVLGPKGAADGIADVVGGNDSAETQTGRVTVPGFTAVKGFDVASSWGTLYAPKFVPSLVAATRNTHQDKSVREQAQEQLTALSHDVTMSSTDVAMNGVSYLLSPGYLPQHPVKLFIDGRYITTLTATALGTVTYMIDPSLLNLKAGTHTVELTSMLINVTGSFKSQ
jgi:subtilase family serine protease